LTVSLIKEKKTKAANLLEQARNINERAGNEGRDLTQNEKNQVDGWIGELEGLRTDIQRMEKLEGYDQFASIGAQVTTDDDAAPNGHLESVPMHNGSRNGSSAGAPQNREEETQEEEVGDPYLTRWDSAGNAIPFRDASVRQNRAYLQHASSEDYEDAFYAYARRRGFTGQHANRLDQVRTMVEGVDADGGYLAPTQLVTGILYEAQVLEELKPRMDVIRSSARSLTYTKGIDSIVMGWVAELGTKPEDQLSFARQVLLPYVGAVVVWVSDELLEDETFGLQSYMQTKVAEAKVLLEEEAFVSGSGSGRPFGILTRLNAQGGTPNRYTTGTASGGSIANFSDDIIKIPYAMKVQYRRNGVYILGTNAIRLARLQRDASGGAGTGGYMWQPSLQAGEPDRLNGYPVLETTSVALNSAIATGNDIGIFGDLKRYRVFERVGLQVKRLEELRALTDEVGFRFRFRTGGDVMLEEAFRTIRAG
jgi:HK97 family phage major capsid protein